MTSGSPPSRRHARALGLWLVGAAMLTGAPAHADPLDEARRHFQRAEYDQALAAIEQVRRGPGAEPARLAEAWLLEGYVDVALDRAPAALEAFDRALRILPSMRPGPEASPKLRGAFAEALGRAEARAARRRAARARLLEPTVPALAHRSFEVTLEVAAPFDGLAARLAISDTDQTGVTVVPLSREQQAGRFRGEVPASLARAGATLTLRAELLDGDEPFAAVPEGAPLAVVVPLARAALDVRAPVDGADVLVDGRAVGKTPLRGMVVVSPGRVTVELRAGRRRARQEAEVRPGELLRLSLAPPEGPAPVVVSRYTLLGVGGALLVVGGVLAGVSAGAASDLVNAQASEQGSLLPTTQFSDVRGFESLGRGASIASLTCLVVGGAAVIVGAALFAVRPTMRDRTPTASTRSPGGLLAGTVRF